MANRKRFSELQVIETLIESGLAVTCHRCKVPFTVADTRQSPFVTKKGARRMRSNIQREHLHELALDGPDVPGNCRFSHYDCHAIVTGGTPASSAGSSANRIAKSKRGDVMAVEKLPPQSPRAKAAAKKEYGWVHRKMQGRGFDKRHRPMRKTK